MPPGNRFKNRGSVLGKIVEQSISENVQVLNAIDFIESPQGLNVQLYPVQRVVVKATFGIPFDYKPRKVPVWDKFREKLLYTFSEEDYLQYVWGEGRCNIGDWRDIPVGGYNEIDIIVGRRGGKSQVISAIGSYALYLLLNIRSPQEYYKLVPGSDIDLTFLAQDDDGANRLYLKMQNDVNRSPFFSTYIVRGGGTTEMTFIAEADRHKRDVIPSIKVKSFPCTTNAVRGPSSYFLALDEFAHFRSAKGSSSDEMYDAATPAAMQFVSPEGERESMICIITSPWRKMGKYYDLHRQAMEDGKNAETFTLRCPTAEMNPRAPSEFLRARYKASPLTWKAEFGGEFLESTESYISSVQLKASIDDGHDGRPNRQNVVLFAPELIGRQYFWGLDLGMKHDATALAIGHLEFHAKMGLELVYDYIDRMMVGEMFDGPGVLSSLMGPNKYKDYKELPLEDIVAWLVALQNIMPCFKGATDQHGGSMLVQLLHMNRITNLELVHLTTAINSQMFFALKGFIDHNRCRFPNVPKFEHEFKQIEAEIIGKYQIRVQAPEEKGAHDDMVDSVALVAWMAQKWLQEEGRLRLDPTGESVAIQEALAHSSGIITDVDAVPLQVLQTYERQRKITKQFGFGGVEVVSSPFFHRGGRGGRGGGGWR